AGRSAALWFFPRRREMKLQQIFLRAVLTRAFGLAIFLSMAALTAQGQMQVYGLWHCYTDACSWASVPDMTLFDTNNHWIIDRGDGHPSVNVANCTNFSSSDQNTASN